MTNMKFVLTCAICTGVTIAVMASFDVVKQKYSQRRSAKSLIDPELQKQMSETDGVFANLGVQADALLRARRTQTPIYTSHREPR